LATSFSLAKRAAPRPAKIALVSVTKDFRLEDPAEVV